MTGEITLRGRVLAIGGLREKTMAAYRNHATLVIIPEDNRKDLDDIDPLVRENLSFVLVNHMDQVLDTVFELHHAADAPSKEEPVPAIPPQVNVGHGSRATIRQ